MGTVLLILGMSAVAGLMAAVGRALGPIIKGDDHEYEETRKDGIAVDQGDGETSGSGG